MQALGFMSLVFLIAFVLIMMTIALVGEHRAKKQKTTP